MTEISYLNLCEDTVYYVTVKGGPPLLPEDTFLVYFITYTEKNKATPNTFSVGWETDPFTSKVEFVEEELSGFGKEIYLSWPFSAFDCKLCCIYSLTEDDLKILKIK